MWPLVLCVGGGADLWAGRRHVPRGPSQRKTRRMGTQLHVQVSDSALGLIPGHEKALLAG